eukprot:gene14230-38506_t
MHRGGAAAAHDRDWTGLTARQWARNTMRVWGPDELRTCVGWEPDVPSQNSQAAIRDELRELGLTVENRWFSQYDSSDDPYVCMKELD